MIGRVVSTKSKNTAVVLVERVASHPLYKKTFKRSKKYLTWDLLGVKDGDMVEIINSKPVSKDKSWKITKVLGKNIAEIAKEHLKKEAEGLIAEVMPEEEKREGESDKGEEVKIEDAKKIKSSSRKNRKEIKREQKGE